MRRRRCGSAGAALALALALGAGAGAAHAAASPGAAPDARAVAPAASAAGDASADGALRACRVAGIRHAVQCGVLRRPLDPAAPAGRRVDIHYVVVPALARRKLPDPLFVLAGGPGQSAIAIAPAMLALFSRTNNRRDLVFVDQRGTGRSAPLFCDEPAQAPLAEQAAPDRALRLLAACRQRLVGLPHVGEARSLGLFTTWIAVQDLDAVRRALGAARVDLVGGSYGTRVALEVLRQFPGTVRRAVLDGVAPPDMALPASQAVDGQAAFDAMLAACRAEPACHAAYPSLDADWAALVRSLPKTVTAHHPLTGAAETFVLTRDALFGALRGPLYTAPTAAALPAAIDAAAHGRYDGLFGVGALFATGRAAQVATGMHFSVVCAEDVPRAGAAAASPGAGIGAGYARFYERACAEWPRGAVPDAFYRVAPSAAPVLVLSGGLDPATPPRHGARVAAQLGAAAQHVVVPNAGHGVLAIGCMRDVVQRFLDADDEVARLPVDAACATRIPRPPAFRPIGAPGAAASAPANPP